MIVIAILVFALAGFFKAMSDTLRNKFISSIFRNWNPLFWDAELSWVNKYKNRTKGDGAKWFGLSTTVLVFLTDAWHFSNFCRISLIALGISFLLVSDIEPNLLHAVVVSLLVYKLPFTISTELFLRLMVNTRPLLRSTDKMSYFKWLRTNGKNYLVWTTVSLLIVGSTFVYGLTNPDGFLASMLVSGSIFLIGTAFIIRAYNDYKKGINR